MGQGERQMRNWAYISSGVGILTAILAVVTSAFVLAVHYDVITFQTTKIMSYVAMGSIVVAGSAFLVHYFAIARVQAADDVYGRVAFETNHPVETVKATSTEPDSIDLDSSLLS